MLITLCSWGESAGALSVALQMVTNGGNAEGLFQAGFMQSGAPPPVGDITDGQSVFDNFVKTLGCSSSRDKLECLRNVPLKNFQDAVNETPTVFSYQAC